MCECASAAVKTKGTTFQSKYNALRVRKSYKQAIISIVHKIVRCIFFILKYKQGYIDPKIDYAAESAGKNARRWVKILCELPDWQIRARNLKSGENFSSETVSAVA